MSKRVRRLRKTIHLVAEGHDDFAFIKHIKAIYSCGGDGSYHISISNAKGKGPNHIISHAISKKRQIGYDLIAVLLDTDIIWSATDKKSASAHNIILLGSTPLCLEGMLLKVLDHKVPSTSDECKNLLHPLLNYKATEVRSYENLFPIDLLQNKRELFPALDKLIKIIETGSA